MTILEFTIYMMKLTLASGLIVMLAFSMAAVFTKGMMLLEEFLMGRK